MYRYSALSISILVLLLLIFGFLLAHKIDLVTADLGRHIKNGEILLKSWNLDVIKTNFYSYTEPDFPAVNHHWLSGIIFFIFWKMAGFSGVHLFFIALSLATFLIFFKIAREKIGVGPASLLALISIPLLAERTEIRPEAFSYLFSGIFLLALFKFQEGKISFKKLLLILLPIQVIWVNTHVFFFFGLVIAGTFIFHKSKHVVLLLGFLTLVSLINPFGINGLLLPLKILNAYGYLLAENQSVWFLENYGIWRPNFAVFKLSLVLIAISFIVVAFAKKFNRRIIENFFLAGGISAMALVQSRNLALFGFFLMPVVAQNIESFLSKTDRPTAEKTHFLKKFKKEIGYFAAGLCFFALFLLMSTNIAVYFPYWRHFGIGIEKDNSMSIKFFKNQNFSGPIFNNYDIGGYLIFHLYPQEKVFVDNRPEAYSVDFFKKIYIPAQEDDEEWKKLNEKYKFNLIIFSRRDLTPWGQKFLKTRLEDLAWEKVFTDERVIIFKKR